MAAVYIHLTGHPLTPGRTTIQAPHAARHRWVHRAGLERRRLVGIEILDASTRLHQDLLDEVEING